MENQKLQQAIENYDVTKDDYELSWELAFSSLVDIEEIVQHAWLWSCDAPNLPVPFVALACRLCLEMSDHPQRLRESLDFLGTHSDYADDANLRIVVRRLNIPLDSTHLDER